MEHMQALLLFLVLCLPSSSYESTIVVDVCKVLQRHKCLGMHMLPAVFLIVWLLHVVLVVVVRLPVQREQKLMSFSLTVVGGACPCFMKQDKPHPPQELLLLFMQIDQ